MRIGVDFGGVLTETTAPPSGNYLATQPRHDALSTLTRWREAGHTLVLVSKAGTDLKEMQGGLWLAHHYLYRAFDTIKFCRTQEGKIDICQSYGLEVMVDDTERQLHLLAGVVAYRLLFGTNEAPEGMTPVADWRETDRKVRNIESLA